MKKSILLAAALIAAVTLAVRAQNPSLKYTEIKGPFGKPFGRIRNITQDVHGYMWFSDESNQCLYRYDGKAFTVFRHDEKNPNSISSGAVTSVYGDPKGLIWIAVGHGLDRFDPATGIFTHYTPDPNNPASLAAPATEIVRDKKGRLWVGTGKSVDLFHEENSTFEHFGYDETDPYSIFHVGVWNLYEDRQGTIWAACGIPWAQPDPEIGGLYKINEGGTVTRFAHDPNDPNTLINNKVRAMFEDSRGVFWVGTGGDGLHTLDRKTGKFTRFRYDRMHPEKLSRPPVIEETKDKFAHDTEQITFITEDTLKNIWIGTMWNGVNIYNPDSQKVTYYPTIGSSVGSTWNAFRSKDGILWITTNSNTEQLLSINPFHKESKSIATQGEVSKFYQEVNGNLWVSAHEGGLRKYDENFNLLESFNHSDRDPNSLHDVYNTIVNMSPHGDSIWLGTRTGLEIFDKKNNRFSLLTTKDKKDSLLRTKPVTQVLKENPDTYWINSWGNGLIRYNRKDNTLTQYIPHKGDAKSIIHETTISILKDTYGNIWVSSFGGISRFLKESDGFQNYSFSGSGASCFFLDSNGTLWAGTGIGLHYYDEKTDSFRSFFDAESGLRSLHVSSITEDSRHNLWLNAGTSLVRVNLSNNEVLLFGEEYGIKDLSRPNIMLKDGRLLAGSYSKFFVLTPEDLYVDPPKPKILISTFLVNGDPVGGGNELLASKTIDDLNDIHLRYNQNNVSFNFAAADYRSPAATRYFGWMENRDTTWRESKDNERLDYFNLPPGRYLFKMRAYLQDGTIGERSLHLHISPPWWLTWWAYFSYAVFFILSIWSASTYRARSLARQNKLLEEKVTLRTNALNNSISSLKAAQNQLIQSEKMASLGELTAGIAHEIQNPLNFVNNFSEVNKELIAELTNAVKSGNLPEAEQIAKDIESNEDKINYHGKRADAIVKSMLLHSRKSSGQKEHTDINALCDEYLRLAYHGLRAKDKSFNAKFETRLDPALPRLSLVPQDMGRVILNLINNAFYAVSEKLKVESQKPGPNFDPTVTVTTKGLGDRIEIRIKDNGNGIPDSIKTKIFQPFFTTKPAGEGTGLGLSLTYDIIKTLGGEIEVESKEGEGSEFIIRLRTS